MGRRGREAAGREHWGKPGQHTVSAEAEPDGSGTLDGSVVFVFVRVSVLVTRTFDGSVCRRLWNVVSVRGGFRLWKCRGGRNVHGASLSGHIERTLDYLHFRSGNRSVHFSPCVCLQLLQQQEAAWQVGEGLGPVEAAWWEW